MLILQSFGWLAVVAGGTIVVALPLLLLLITRSRSLPRNTDRRREALVPLWRLIPVWLYLVFATARTGHDLLSGAREPRWLMVVGLFLSGMMVWSSVEVYLAARRRGTQERHEREAYRRDTHSGPSEP